MTWDEVEWCGYCCWHAVMSSVIYYSTHTWKNVIYLFYTIKIQMVYWRILGAKKGKQVCWRDLTWIWRHLCVCPLIDYGQQPMKMHTEVALLYNIKLLYNLKKCFGYSILFRLQFSLLFKLSAKASGTF